MVDGQFCFSQSNSALKLGFTSKYMPLCYSVKYIKSAFGSISHKQMP